RIEKSIGYLLHGNDSISKIAINNGFPNAKAYSEAFKKNYNMAPGAYRQRFGGVSQPPDKMEEYGSSIEHRDGDFEFLRYVKRYDLDAGRATPPERSFGVDVNNAVVTSYKKHDNILNIGRIDLISQPDFFQNLNKLQKSLNFKYIYFQLEADKLPFEAY